MERLKALLIKIKPWIVERINIFGAILATVFAMGIFMFILDLSSTVAKPSSNELTIHDHRDAIIAECLDSDHPATCFRIIISDLDRASFEAENVLIGTK